MFSHGDFLLCKHNCVSYAWLEIFGKGSLGQIRFQMGHYMKKGWKPLPYDMVRVSVWHCFVYPCRYQKKHL